jgi:4-hydroxy-tetrahydrodipicolinate synthase
MAFKGLCAFPITPMDAEGRVDAAAFAGLLRRLVAAKVDSIGVLGSTGTYMYLSRAERRRAVEIAAAEAAGIPLLVGIGALRTDETVTLARDARAAGASAGLLAAVSYTPLRDNEVFAHFATVAGQGGLPLVIYDNPATTHFHFGPELVARLSRVPNIVAIKSTAPAEGAAAHVAALRAAVPPGFFLGYAGDWNVAPALLAGAEAWYSVLGGLCPDVCLQLVRAAAAGDVATVAALQARLEPVWALFRQHTSLRVVYAAARELGITDRDPPLPIAPLPADVRRQVAATFSDPGLSSGGLTVRDGFPAAAGRRSRPATPRSG